jgi:hypothetical protein
VEVTLADGTDAVLMGMAAQRAIRERRVIEYAEMQAQPAPALP